MGFLKNAIKGVTKVIKKAVPIVTKVTGVVTMGAGAVVGLAKPALGASISSIGKKVSSIGAITKVASNVKSIKSTVDDVKKSNVLNSLIPQLQVAQGNISNRNVFGVSKMNLDKPKSVGTDAVKENVLNGIPEDNTQVESQSQTQSKTMKEKLMPIWLFVKKNWYWLLPLALVALWLLAKYVFKFKFLNKGSKKF